jgi:hypothetical protein
MAEYQPFLSNFVELGHVLVYLTDVVPPLLTTQVTYEPANLYLHRVFGRVELARVLFLPFQAGLTELQPTPLLVYV